MIRTVWLFFALATYSSALLPYTAKGNLPIHVVRGKGERTELSCSVAGSPQTHTLWYKNHRILLKSDRIHLRKTLVIDNLSFEDAGNYTCLSCNVYSCINRTYSLQVVDDLDRTSDNSEVLTNFLSDDNFDKDEDIYETYSRTKRSTNDSQKTPPVFVYPGKMSSVVVKPAGNMLSLKCTSSGSPAPNVTWYKNNKTPQRKLGEIRDHGSITMEDLTVEDTGNYTCIVCNELGCIQHTYFLEVTKDFIWDRSKRETERKAPYFVNPKKMPRLEVKHAGNMVNLKCKAGGFPTPNITWWKNDKTPPKRQLGEIRYQHWGMALEDLVTDDTGNYTCVVCNELGCINFTYSVEVIERFPSKPHIKNGYPQNFTVLVNTSVKFECPQTIPDIEPYIEWIKMENRADFDENSLTLGGGTYENTSFAVVQKSGDTDNPEVHEVKNVTLQDEGWYVCIATNSLGQTASKGYLKVIEKIVETKIPESSKKYILNTLSYLSKLVEEDLNHNRRTKRSIEQVPPFFINVKEKSEAISVLDGDSILLECESKGTPPPNTTWYKNDELLESRYHFSTLPLNNVTLKDSGNYKCLVCNEIDCVDHVFKVKVIVSFPMKPIIIDYVNNITLLTGDSKNLTCDFPKGSRIYWSRKLSNGSSVFVKESSSTYQIQNATRWDEGWYSCISVTDFGTKEIARYLTVLDDDDSNDIPEDFTWVRFKRETERKAPYFVNPKKMPRLEVKPAGNMVNLKCKAGGFPTPNITWWKNDKTPPKRQLGEIRYQHWGMALEDLVTDDTGNYTCVVCNELGCINFTYSVEVIERYHNKPVCTHPLENMTVVVGSNVNLTCTFLSHLNPYISWTRQYNATYAVVVQKSGDTDNPEVYEVKNVTYQDEGWYACIAANSLGQTASRGYLKVVDRLVGLDVEQKFNSNNFITYAAIAIILILLAVCSIVVVFFKKLKIEKQKKILALETVRAAVVTQWTKKVIIEKIQNTTEDVSEPLLMPVVKIEKQKTQNNNSGDGMISEYELPMDSDWEIPRAMLSLGKSLGEGAFGKVVKAEAIGLLKPGVTSIVAVKMLKEGHTDNEMMDLVSEMEMMKMIGKHINIINLLGCCTQGGPLYVVVEFAPHGNLRDFLRQHRPSSGYEPAIGIVEKERKTLTQKDLVSFAYQVARGMEYLASRRCIHRDLAARNVLVSDDYILKIADFGLARDIHCNDYYRKTTDGRLPVKWMAPEALFHRVYTTQSDVWSYGILLWEIMTLGGTPYPSVPSVEKLFQLLRNGHRMEKPPCCSLEIYILMRECWSYQPNERPIFSQLVEDLDRILTFTANEEYLDLGLPQLDTPPSSQESTGDEEDFPFANLTSQCPNNVQLA
ncbi:fibroblast growth factor receptor 3-like isoform X3 [Zophobas morio]|uniref:fibroblast growth factor receptor 3-like isoform X3 n=1 Tax=Zophobas morio TaxID=2755281 RepID=UPI003083BE72